ncbi:MAG: CbiX/SirB N-terminal domain-containing protein [Polyangiaceae bacterium]|nr:CbiX/SirB N-terminal domain-containing protein [Polyangiaceae bacterium]
MSHSVEVFEEHTGEPSATGPAFLLLGDLGAAAPELEVVRERTAKVLGFAPALVTGYLPTRSEARAGFGAWEADPLKNPVILALSKLATAGHSEVYILPVRPDLGITEKQIITEAVRETQRTFPNVRVRYDSVEPCHPLLLSAYLESAALALHRLTPSGPGQLGVLLVSSGEDDAVPRAHAYQLMRLLWEQLGVAKGEVAFLRHNRTPVPEQLDACLATGLSWVVVPQFLFPTEHFEFLQTIYTDFVRRHEIENDWALSEPIAQHPAFTAWLEQRLVRIWQENRDKTDARQPTAKPRSPEASLLHRPDGAIAMRPDTKMESGYPGAWLAEIRDPSALTQLTRGAGIEGERIFVKVTWHGYAQGTYTDPVALETLLKALPGRAVILEGHTSSRNQGGAEWDWENESRAHRAWIVEQDREYLERTGILEVLERYGATYLNLTETWWDGACAPAAEVHALLKAQGVELKFSELAEFVPRVFLENRGAPFISYARFKGPTRLSLANLFGLLPPPLRTAWHGPNITYFAQVCCDLAKLYGALFTTYGLVESLNVAVRWDRKGLYRSRWGNYDLVPRPGLVTLAAGFAGADVLGSRLQGQDVRKSAFFDVVRQELGYNADLETLPVNADLVRRFV